MTVQLSVLARNARLDAIETLVAGSPSPAPTLEIRSGNQPANCATADSGDLLCVIPLPGDWMNAAAGGQKTKNGTWSAAAIGAGTAGHFRIKSGIGSPNDCILQGDVTDDMTLDNTSIAVSQIVTVNTFTLTDGNA